MNFVRQVKCPVISITAEKGCHYEGGLTND